MEHARPSRCRRGGKEDELANYFADERRPATFDLHKCKSLWGTFEHVFVIVEDEAQPGRKGAIESIHAVSRYSSEHTSTKVVSFADVEDAERYLSQLQESMKAASSPVLMQVGVKRLVHLCEANGFKCTMQAPKANAMRAACTPPEYYKSKQNGWSQWVDLSFMCEGYEAPDPDAGYYSPRNLPPIEGMSPSRLWEQPPTPTSPPTHPELQRLCAHDQCEAVLAEAEHGSAHYADVDAQSDATSCTDSAAAEPTGVSCVRDHARCKHAFKDNDVIPTAALFGGDLHSAEADEALARADCAFVRGGEDSPLRSRDIAFAEWVDTASPHCLTYGYSPHTIQPELSAMSSLIAENNRVHKLLDRESSRLTGSGIRTVRVFGKEMYLPGMAPTAEDPIDLPLLEYLWDISGGLDELHDRDSLP